MDQGFKPIGTAPCNTLGQTCANGALTATAMVSGALIGTYCTQNNNALADIDTTFTGDFISIDGKLFFMPPRSLGGTQGNDEKLASLQRHNNSMKIILYDDFDCIFAKTW